MNGKQTVANGDGREELLKDFLHDAHSLLVLCQEGHHETSSSVLQMAHDLLIAVRTVPVAQVTNVLESATMGTRLYVCGDWSFVHDLEGILHSFGVTDEEWWSEVIGPRSHPVLCAGCYHRNGPSEGPYIHCEKCRRMLEVSNHYSIKLAAVMGYIVLPEQLLASSAQQHTAQKTEAES